MEYEETRPPPLVLFWRKARWILIFAAFAAIFGALAIIRMPETQSRWVLHREGSMPVFVEKATPRDRSAALLRAVPEAAESAFRAAGLDYRLDPALDLPLFASWGGFGALTSDDPVFRNALKGRPSGEIRLIGMFAGTFKLDEPVAPCFVTNDGGYLFIDLAAGRTEAAVVHGLAHALARRNMPDGVRALVDPMHSGGFNAKAARAFRFLDETAALFLSDFAESASSRAAASEIEAYDAYVRERYAPGGSFLRDENLSIALGSDPRRPEVFAASAELARRIVAESGLGAMAGLCSALLGGDYGSLDSLAALALPAEQRAAASLSAAYDPLRGGLALLLQRHLGSPEVPE
jgi:hypothetical protein